MPSGEFDFINWIRSQQHASARVPLPAGDDLAVLRWDGADLLLVGVDQVLDGVHFDSLIHGPVAIGRKVMNRNLSDCAAMACLPAAAVATVALPRGRDLDYAKELYRGLKEAADSFDCPIVGGDTASWDGRLLLTVSILGKSAGIEPVTRRGAKAGQMIYVTGPLGGSILGRHMDFVPRIDLARRLAGTEQISAMIDISDGLWRDLRHICQQSGVGAIIDAAAVPIHGDAVVLGQRDGRTALDHALHDGEDHELIFTAPAGQYPESTAIGVMTEQAGIYLRTGEGLAPIGPGGWEHRL